MDSTEGTHPNRQNNSSSNDLRAKASSDMGVCNASANSGNQHLSEQTEKSTGASTVTWTEFAFSINQTDPAPIRGLSSPTMSGSRVPRKRKSEQKPEPDNTGKEGGRHSSKRAREEHGVDKSVAHDELPIAPQDAARDQPLVTIGSDISVTTRSRTATNIKIKKPAASDRCARPATSQADPTVDKMLSQHDSGVLRHRIRELEEERNDYQVSPHKETEKAMERGRKLLLLHAKMATTTQQENPSIASTHQRYRNHRDNEGDSITVKTTLREETSPGQQIRQADKRLSSDDPISFISVLEGELQRQVEDLRARLSGAESEIANKVAQNSRLLKYKRQDGQFAAKCRSSPTKDCEMAQSTEESMAMDLGKEQALLKEAPSNILQSGVTPLASANARALQELNSRLFEKLRKSCSAAVKLETEVQELRKSMEITVQSRDEGANSLRNAIQSHSRERSVLEGRIRSLEFDNAQTDLEIQQLNKKSAATTSLQDLADHHEKSLAHLRESHRRDRQALVEELQSLGCKNTQLEEDKIALAAKISELKERFQKMSLKISDSQAQVCSAAFKNSQLQGTVRNLETRLCNVTKEHTKNVHGLEANIRELSDSFKNTTTEMAQREEELSLLRAACLERERALQKTQENHKSAVRELNAKIYEASKAEAEIGRLRPFEHAVDEYYIAVKRFEHGREEVIRQQQEQMRSLQEARQEITLLRDANRELQGKNEGLESRAGELQTTRSEDEARFMRFLGSIATGLRRQIEEPGGEPKPVPDIIRPDDATVKELGDRLQRKLDMLEHELQWYKDSRSKIYKEYRQLEQWRIDLASDLPARLGLVDDRGPR